ncbi:MAG: hypothetical protein Q8Q20_05465 [bacterium]|nr:hypothetical protein [bacterium]
MADIIIVIIAVLSLAGIAWLTSRHWQQLLAYRPGADNERVERRKQDIISQRLERKFTRVSLPLVRSVRPAVSKAFEWARRSYHGVRNLENKYRHLSEQEAGEDLKTGPSVQYRLRGEIDEHIQDENYADAEKKLIELISLDAGDPEHYRRLGHLYVEMKEFGQAVETFSYVLILAAKLKREQEVISGSDVSEEASDHINLGLAYRGLSKYPEALKEMERACQLESNNPRNLDLLLETSILAQDKMQAWSAFDRLKAVNPENQKLAQFEEQIHELESKSRNF